MSTPLVVFRIRYHTKGSLGWEKYSSSKKDDFINYIEKGISDDKKQDDFLSYVGNPEKSFGVFSQNRLLNAKDKKELREKLRSTKSIIWDAVISLESAYGKEYLYSNDRAMEMVNKVFPRFLKEAGFDPKRVNWYAGLHENTDNRHVHISWFETEPSHYSRKKRSYVYHQGRISPACLNAIKADVERFFETDQDMLKNHRKQLLEDFKSNPLSKSYSQYQDGLKSILKGLVEDFPKDGSLDYSSGNMAPYRERLDEAVELILHNPIYVRDYQKMQNNLEGYDEKMRAICKKNNADPKYFLLSDKFEKDLKRRMANVLIRQLIDLRKESYKEVECIQNGNLRRKDELRKTMDIVLNMIQRDEYYRKEEYLVFEEYLHQLKKAELERKIEEGETTLENLSEGELY